jgi:tRNA (adenine57-N1/adenine58-N1)-methyltransferase
MSDIVSIECRDVCKDGFGMKDCADAVFLDLPSPWEMVHFAKEAIKTTGGRLCSFSPCIEQVQRTCQELRNAKFDDVEVMECLLRPFDVRPCVINIANLGGEGENQRTAPPIESTVSMYTCAPHRDIPGHTGYLTFATLHHK